MILVLILSGIVVILMILFILVILSTARINIDTFKIDNTNNKINKEIKVFLDIYFLNKIKIARIKIDDIRANKIKKKYTDNKINRNIMKKDNTINKALKEVIEHKKTNITKLNLDIKLGLIDGILTSGGVAVLSTVISIILSLLVKEYKKDKINYKITPIYTDDIILKIFLSCIIEVKTVHIIYMIYVLLKKGRVRVNERTSNRRSYAYSYE